jgi:NAD+ kinase
MKPVRVLLVVNATKPDAVGAATDIAAWCCGHETDCAEVGSATRISARDLVCALGGDGTVLRAAALAAHPGAPVLGINVGSLGFLSQTSLDGVSSALERILRGDYEVEERMRLAYSAGGIEGTALNDLGVSAIAPRLLEMRLSWRGAPASSLLGDGMIFSTPTGATAYSLSLGGPIVVPTADCLLVTPHGAHVLGTRPIVFGGDEELRLRASADARLVADGDDVGRVLAGTDIIVRRAPTPTLLVRAFDGPDFFSTLSRKLNWPSADLRRVRPTGS